MRRRKKKTNNYFGTGKEVLKGRGKVEKKILCLGNNDFQVIETDGNIIWDWENFETTEGFPVSDKLLDWVIGQDHALKECYLCLDEWVYKLRYLQKERWYAPWLDPMADKPMVKHKLTPGPYLLLLGDPGTGKSLIGKALAEKLTEVYKKNKIKMFDILTWANPIIPSEPKISIHEAGGGIEVVQAERKKGKTKSWVKGLGFKLIIGLILGLGLTIMSVALWNVFSPWFLNSADGGKIPVQTLYAGNFFSYISDYLMKWVYHLALGGGMVFSGAFLYFIAKTLGGMVGQGSKGIGGASSSQSPKIIVNNTQKIAPFIDATGHSSSQLFGSIAWDPYQTGGLGTPEHQRVSAGDVHRAALGILYIDEIKNIGPLDAVTLLTVLEEGQLPVTLRSQMHGGDTAAMAVSTEPIPCMVFLVGAGNFDSIAQIHPALMDRIAGYGKVVRMTNRMANTIKNRRKYIQFIAQEGQRFHLPPFSREACVELVDEGRRRSERKRKLTTKFRPLISIIKTAGTLAQIEKSKLVQKKHVIEAINEHCKSIQKQLLEHSVEETKELKEIDPQGVKLGQLYGLAVVGDPRTGEKAGAVLRVKAQMIKKSPKKKLAGYYRVTGIAKKDEKWIRDSIDKVRSVILKKYNIDIAQEYFTHIDFSQAYGVDGPSAGVTMAILIASILEGKPLRQDIAVTGEINIGSTDEIEITAVGGLYEKIKAAEAWGFKKVVIPYKNYTYSIDTRDYEIEVVGGKTLEDYLKEVFVGKEDEQERKAKD